MATVDDMNRKDQTVEVLTGALNDGGEKLGATLDAIIFHEEDGSPVNESLVTLDTMIKGEDGEEAVLSLSAGLQAMATTPTIYGEPVDGATLDAMIASTAAVGESNVVTMDGINSVAGSGVVATTAAINQYVVKNSQLAGLIGMVGDMEKVGSGKNIRFKVFSIDPYVTEGMGALAKDTRITPQNAGELMALSQRFGTLVTVDGTTNYTFTAKAKDTDASGFKLAMGVSCAIIGDTGITLDDYDAKSQEMKPKRNATINDKQVTMEVDRAAGTVKVTVEAGALPEGTMILIETALDYEEMSKIRGTVGAELVDHDYVATPVTIATSASVMDTRQVSQQLQYGLLAGGLNIAGSKIVAENVNTALRKAEVFRKLHGTPVDLTKNTGLATTAEAYKGLPVAIDSAAVSINEESMLGDRVMVVGGKGLVKAFNMLAKNTDGLNVRDTNDANAIKFLGFLDGKYRAVYDPKHDAKNPLVDENGEVNADAALNVYHTLNIYGTPANPSKRIIVGGIGLPIIPVDLKINDDSQKKFSLEGKEVLSVNKDPKSQKLARKILFAL